MAVRSQAWEQVGERFETLGTHLRGHFDEVGTDAAEERAAFEKSVRGLLSALEDGFAAARRAVRDPALRDDVGDVASSVREAMLATFETAGDQVRERLSMPARTGAGRKATTPRGRSTTKSKTTTAKAPARKRTGT